MAEPSAIKAMVLSIVFILQGEFVRPARSSYASYSELAMNARPKRQGSVRRSVAAVHAGLAAGVLPWTVLSANIIRQG